MNGSQHYTAGERLLSDASFLTLSDQPIKRNGEPFAPGEREALIDRAMAHFAAAEAAAAALRAVLPLVGGDSDEVTEWARAIGALDGSAKQDVVEAVIYPKHWPPAAGDVWANWSSRWFAQRLPEEIQMVPAYTGSDLSPNAACSPEELLKRDSTLTLVSREEAPF